MPICVKCSRDVCNPCVRGSKDEGNLKRILVASDRELRNTHYCHRLAIATANLGLPRREIPNWTADVIFEYEGRILWPNLKPFTITNTAIDDAFNDDGSFRWFSSFIQFKDRFPKMRPQYRILRRLRLIDLAFRIDKPDIARHFGR